MNQTILQYDQQLTPAALRLVAAVEAREQREAADGIPREAQLSPFQTEAETAPGCPKKTSTPLDPAKAERLSLLREAGQRIRAKLEAKKK